MTSFIKVPFASSGDKVAVPDTDAGGGVNMTQGYGQAYSLDPATDPSAKRIERDKMNWLFNIITQAINEIQSGGVAPFITSADNGGSAFSYGKGALVSLGGVVYQSLVANNTATPPGANWAALPEKIQPLDATLTALAGLVGAANKLPYFNGADTAALTDLTSVGRDIIGKADVAAVLTYLGFTQVGRDIIAGGTASDVLAYLGVPNLLNGKQDADNTLTALARLAGAANKLPYFSGPDVMSMTDFSDIGRAIIAASDKPSVLSYLELTTLGQALVKGGTASDILRTLGFNNGNGWYRIGEILIQFGHIPFAATSVPVTFPIPFPVVIDQIIVSDAGYASGNTWGATDRTQLGFTAQTNSTGQGGQYFAIGR